MANTYHKFHFHTVFAFDHAYPPQGVRLRRGIFIRVTSFIPPVETGGYDSIYA